MRNLESPRPMRTCRKKTGPRESSLIAAATRRNDRSEHEKPDERNQDVHRALEKERRSRPTRRWETYQRQSFGGMHGRVRTQRLEEAGDDVDLHPALVEVADVLERLLVRMLERRRR